MFNMNSVLNEKKDEEKKGEAKKASSNRKDEPTSISVPGERSYELPPIPFPGGMTLDQIDVIMSLVSVAENGTVKWWKNYSYCEDIKDKRGMTCSLVGFCSGTSDLLWVFEKLNKLFPAHPLLKYLPVLKKVNNTSNTKGLEGLAADLKIHNDAHWKEAVWNGIFNFYFRPAMAFADEIGAQFAISKGHLYDTALNHGANMMNKFAKKVKVPTPKDGGDEKVWLAEFIAVRQHIIQNVDRSTNFGQPDRCIMWNSLLESGNVNLERPITVKCYKSKFTVK